MPQKSSSRFIFRFQKFISSQAISSHLHLSWKSSTYLQFQFMLFEFDVQIFTNRVESHNHILYNPIHLTEKVRIGSHNRPWVLWNDWHPLEVQHSEFPTTWRYDASVPGHGRRHGGGSAVPERNPKNPKIHMADIMARHQHNAGTQFVLYLKHKKKDIYRSSIWQVVLSEKGQTRSERRKDVHSFAHSSVQMSICSCKP